MANKEVCPGRRGQQLLSTSLMVPWSAQRCHCLAVERMSIPFLSTIVVKIISRSSVCAMINVGTVIFSLIT